MRRLRPRTGKKREFHGRTLKNLHYARKKEKFREFIGSFAEAKGACHWRQLMLQLVHNQIEPDEPDRILWRLAGEETLENLISMSAEGARRQPNLSGKRTEDVPFPDGKAHMSVFSGVAVCDSSSFLFG